MITLAVIGTLFAVGSAVAAGTMWATDRALDHYESRGIILV